MNPMILVERGRRHKKKDSMAYTVLDPVNKHANTVVDTDTHFHATTNWGTVMGITGQTLTGKFYHEMTIHEAGQQYMMGVGPPTIYTALFVGIAGSTGKSYFDLNGRTYDNGVWATFGASWSALNDTAGCAVDLAAGKIWFSKNGVWQASGDPANGTNPAITSGQIQSGTWHPAFSQYDSDNSGEGAEVDMGSNGFTYTPPTGFTGWPE